jgi:four helix bundle protein
MSTESTRNTAARMLQFATECFRLTSRLNRTMAGRYLANQLMRSSASSGANYQEACGAESKADFLHKMQLVLKELRESNFWLQLLSNTELIPEDTLRPLQTEADELVRIFAKSVVTIKSKPR